MTRIPTTEEMLSKVDNLADDVKVFEIEFKRYLKDTPNIDLINNQIKELSYLKNAINLKTSKDLMDLVGRTFLILEVLKMLLEKSVPNRGELE